MKCDALQSIHLQYWVACGLWHHYCPSHLEAPGMVWVGECASLYLRAQCVSACVRLHVCVVDSAEGQMKGNHSNRS